MGKEKMPVDSETLQDARDRERYHRESTKGEASEDTGAVFKAAQATEEEAAKREFEKARYGVDAPEADAERERKEHTKAQEAIARIRTILQEKEPERPDYDHPPTNKPPTNKD